MHINKKKKYGGILKKLYVALMLFFLCTTCGCSIEKTSNEKIRDVEYTIVEDEDVPEELMKLINDSKEEIFNLNYKDKGYLYMVKGYGPQPTTGYGITLEEIYETDTSICVKTMLKGPAKTEKVNNVITYPYIVIKVENIDKIVLFE